MAVEITIKRHHWSRRVRLSVQHDGRVVVTMPKRASMRRVLAFIEEKRVWIEEKVKSVKGRVSSHHPQPLLGEEGRQKVRELIEPIVDRYCQMFGVTCKRISIRNQRSRWGSCSSKQTLSFNVRLMTLPRELVEYVVVHEVCHLLEMNHSSRFWQFVATALPDFRNRRAVLKRIDHV